MDYPKTISLTFTDLVSLSKSAKDLISNKRNACSVNSGSHNSRLLGRGMEFAETRHYQAGDDIRTIDWRVTARTGTAHTKLFTAEKERQVLICVDMRSPMFFASQGAFKSVQAASLASLLAWNGVHEGDRIGGILFDNKETVQYRPARGKQGALPFLQALSEYASFTPTKMSQQPVPDLEGPITRLRQLVRPGSSVFIISDFRNPYPKMAEHLYHIASHSHLTLCFIYDPLEECLPENQNLPVSAGQNRFTLNTHSKKYLEAYKKKFDERKKLLDELKQHRHVQLITCSTQDNCLETMRR